MREEASNWKKLGEEKGGKNLGRILKMWIKVI